VNPYNELKLLAGDVPKGTTANGLSCPFCRGGRHGEKALTVTVRDDGATLFICHRASCSKAGRIYPNGSVTANTDTDQPPRFVPRVYQGKTRVLNSYERGILEANYGLTYRELNFHRLCIDVETERLVIRLLGPDGTLRGHQLSCMPNNPLVPKALTYKEKDLPFNGWFATENSDWTKLVLVEDAISAMRVARQYPCVSLMGTTISQEALFEMLQVQDHLVIALDRDASAKALDYQKKYKFVAPQIRVALLEKDLKWLPDAEIKEKVDI